MSEKEDVGLENTDFEDNDFIVEELEPKNQTAKDDEQKEKKEMTVISRPWKEVSHVVIGPKGVSLVPAGTDKKFPYPSRSETEHPSPGVENAVLNYDLNDLVGAIERVSDLEKELTSNRAELEKANAELAEFAKKKGETPPEEDDKKEKPKEEDRTEEERAMAHWNISKEEWDKISDEKKKELIAKLPPRGSANKENKAKKEKEDASVKTENKDEEKENSKEADHEDNLSQAVHLMQVARQQGKL